MEAKKLITQAVEIATSASVIVADALDWLGVQKIRLENIVQKCARVKAERLVEKRRKLKEVYDIYHELQRKATSKNLPEMERLFQLQAKERDGRKLDQAIETYKDLCLNVIANETNH